MIKNKKEIKEAILNKTLTGDGLYNFLVNHKIHSKIWSEATENYPNYNNSDDEEGELDSAHDMIKEGMEEFLNELSTPKLEPIIQEFWEKHGESVSECIFAGLT